jgi:hypothetical protein
MLTIYGLEYEGWHSTEENEWEGDIFTTPMHFLIVDTGDEDED